MRFRALPNTKVPLVKAVVRRHHVIFVILQRVTKNGKRSIGVTVDAVFDRFACLVGPDDEHVTQAMSRQLRLERVHNHSFGVRGRVRGKAASREARAGSTFFVQSLVAGTHPPQKKTTEVLMISSFTKS